MAFRARKVSGAFEKRAPGPYVARIFVVRCSGAIEAKVKQTIKIYFYLGYQQFVEIVMGNHTAKNATRLFE